MNALTGKQQLLEETAEWFALLQERPLSDSEQQAFANWLARSPAHRAAWQKVENLLAKLGGVPADMAMPVLDRPVDAERRAIIGRLAMLVFAVPIGGAGIWQLSQSHLLRGDIFTANAERKQLQLADGSMLWLNASSAADIDLSRGLRAVHLRKGELSLQVVNGSQPFMLSTPEGACRIYDKATLTLRRNGNISCLDVLEGKVQLQLAASSTSLQLEAGQALQFSAHEILNQLPVNSAHSAWRFGMLVADNMRLQEVAAALQAYRHGRIDVQPELADLPISGAFPLDDVKKTLQMLADTYQLRISEHWLGYRVIIAAA